MMVSEKRLRKLEKKGYRQEYLRNTVVSWVVHQLRALRGQRNWTQSDLAHHAGKPQSAIARWENEDYGNWSTKTLLEMAEAFDVALEIRFLSWPEFISRTADTSEEVMRVSSFSAADFEVADTTYQRGRKIETTSGVTNFGDFAPATPKPSPSIFQPHSTVQ